METLENTCDYICFVVDDRNQRSDIMKKAFISLRKRKLSVKWIIESNLEKIAFEDIAFFVLDVFSGSAFDILRQQNVRIISPYVVKYCDADSANQPLDSIPNHPYPIYSQCMHGLCISTTNISREAKNEIKDRVKLMCGTYNSCLTADTNYLISDSVLTQKYQAAILLKIPIIKQEWITACWERFQFDFRLANESEIVDQFRLPIFYGLTITVSHVDFDERKKIDKLIRDNGGNYSPSLQLDIQNMILLTNERSGDKYFYASKRDIPRLRVQWLYDSIEKKYALSPDGYSLDKDDSNLFHGNKRTTDDLVGHQLEDLPLSVPESTSTNEDDSSIVNVLNDLYVPFADRESSFLDKCVLFAIGFDQKSIKSLSNVARHCGAIYMNEYKPMVTHIIVGSKLNQNDQQLLEKYQDVYMVTIEWLYESIKLKICCDKNMFRYCPKLKGRRKIDMAKLYKFCTEEIIKQAKIPKKSTIEEDENPIIDLNYTDDGFILDPECFPRISDFSPPEYPPPKKSSKRVIMLSGFEPTERESLIDLIRKNLDGRVYDEPLVSRDVTHLILNDLYATEKTLSALASCIWIVKPEYIHDSIENGNWLSELSYQWGCKQMDKDKTLSSNEQTSSSSTGRPKKNLREQLMSAASLWREYHLRTGLYAFQDWTILVLNTTDFIQSTIRVLSLGRAKLFFLNEFVGSRETELKEIMKTIHYAIIDLKFKEKPSHKINRFLELVKYLIDKQKVIRHEDISRYIIGGEPGSFTIPKSSKSLLTYNDLIESVESFFNKNESM